MKAKLLLAISLVLGVGLLSAQTLYGAFKIETTPRGADVNLYDIDMYLCSTPSPVYPVFMDEYMELRSGIPGREINLIITRKNYVPLKHTIFVPFLYTDQEDALNNPTVFVFHLTRDHLRAHVEICTYYTYNYPRPRPVAWYVPWYVWYPTNVYGYTYPPPPRPPHPHNPPHHPGGGYNPPPPGGGHGGSHGGGNSGGHGSDNPPLPPGGGNNGGGSYPGGGNGGSHPGSGGVIPPGGGGSNPPSGSGDRSKPQNYSDNGGEYTFSTRPVQTKPPSNSGGTSKPPKTTVIVKPADNSRSNHVLNPASSQSGKSPAPKVSGKATDNSETRKTTYDAANSNSKNYSKPDDDQQKEASGLLRKLQKLSGK